MATFSFPQCSDTNFPCNDSLKFDLWPADSLRRREIQTLSQQLSSDLRSLESERQTLMEEETQQVDYSNIQLMCFFCMVRIWLWVKTWPLSHRFLMMFVDVGSKIRSKLHFLVVWPIPAHRPGVLPDVFSILKQKRVSSKFIEFWQARSSLFCSCICCMKFATDSLIFLPFSSTDSWLFRRWKRWIGVVP